MSGSIEDIREFYILGLPIQTEIGDCHFITVADYPNYFVDLQIISMTKDHIIQRYSKANKNGEYDELISNLRELSFFQIMVGIPDMFKAYSRIFDKVFNIQEAINRIKSEEEFNYYRSLIMKMSCIKEEKINPNPEIQAAIERSRRVKAQDAEKLEFADMVTSIASLGGFSYGEINDLTLFQMHMTYYRFAQIKSYDTSTLFATVSGEVDIENWSKHIDLFEEEKHGIEMSRLGSIAKQIQ